MAENQMIVSDLGILNVNQKIADYRKYDKELIDVEGNVKIENGIASDFSEDSYFHKSNLTFSDSNITIKMNGVYNPIVSTQQVAWFLAGSVPSVYNVVLQFDNNQISLVIGSSIILKFPFLGISDTTPFKSIVELSKNYCRLIIYMRDTIYDKHADLGIPLNLPLLNTLYIGNDPTDFTEFWQGSLDVANFTILENNQVAYTPSTNFPFTFSKILLSDRELGPLTDDSQPVAKHVIEISTDEITRPNSSVLFTSVLGEDIKILIKEIALYIATDEGEKIFSSIRGLNINKGFNVPYDLIFTLDLSVNFLNVVGFPDVNSFFLEEYKPALFKDFKTIQEVTTYAITNLERLIKLNATNIGYDKAQVFYRLQQERERLMDCYSNIQSFSKLMKRLQITSVKKFTPDYIDIIGDVEITEEGVASNFSNSSYINTYDVTGDPNEWEAEISFTVDNIVESPEVIASFVNYKEVESETGDIEIVYDNIQPLTIGINQIDYKNYCFIKMVDSNEEFIINDDRLFYVLLGKKYFLKLRYSSSDNKYIISMSTDGKSYTELKNIYSTEKITGMQILFIGTKFVSQNDETQETVTSNPFSSGFVDLIDWYVITPSNLWQNVDSDVTNNATLAQYYRIPDLPQSNYRVTDICNEEYNIDVFENTFQGNKDLIDFHDRDGFTLCVKVDISDAEPRILLAKTDLIGNPYFILSYLGRTLYFSLYMEDEIFTLSKKIEYDEMSLYIQEPILLTIVLKSDLTFSLYRNNDLIDEIEGIFGTFKNASPYFLTNTVQDSVLESICEDLPDLGELTLEEYMTLVKNNQGRYVQNIIAIKGSLKKDDLYYITNLTDTNY